MRAFRLLAAAASLLGVTGALAQPVSSDVFRVSHERAKAALAQNPGLVSDPQGILVRFRPGTAAPTKAAALQAINGRTAVQYTIVPGLEKIETPMGAGAAIAALKNNPNVIYAEPDFVVRTSVVPNDTHMGLLWGMRNTGQTVNGAIGTAGADTRAHEAWNVSTGDANFVIADIDTGMQVDHPDLAANVWINPGEVAGNGVDDDANGYVDDVNGWDFWEVNNTPQDSGSHGTHTGGTIGAIGNNGIGVAGVNWQCKIMVLKFLGPSGGYISDAILAVQYLTNKGVKVSNNSWGGGPYTQGMYDAINASKAVGHVFCAAAGNSGANADSSPMYPAAYTLDNIISVAATTSTDARASFSNYGASSVDLGAPGVNIASTVPGGGYAYMNGTSMACPHVCGAVALVYARNPGWTYQQVRSQILSTVRPVSSMAGITVTGGILNVAAALGGGSPGNTPPSVTISSPTNGSSVVQGTSVTFTGSSSDTQDGNLSAGLVWTSNLQGTIGNGATFSRSDLVVGTHTVTASSTDSGSLTGSASVQITITPSNTPPTVTIISPANGSSFLQGTSVTFTGSSSDAQDGNLSAGLVWTSNLQGTIGNSASFARTDLVVGTHTITASSTDSGSLTGTKSVQISITTVTIPAAPNNAVGSSPSTGTARVTWSDNSNNEANFEIQRQTRLSNGNWGTATTVGTVGANTTSFQQTLAVGRYRYRVRATNAAGASAYSNWTQSIRVR